MKSWPPTANPFPSVARGVQGGAGSDVGAEGTTPIGTGPGPKTGSFPNKAGAGAGAGAGSGAGAGV